MTENKTNIKVLWIEDEPQDVKIETLEEDGDIKIQIMRDGNEALQYLRLNTPDIVILDIMLPPGTELSHEDVKNGYETGFVLLKKIRRELNLHMPLIVLTLYPKMMPAEEQRDLDIVEYISKPIKMKFLAELIRQYAKERNRNESF